MQPRTRRATPFGIEALEFDFYFASATWRWQMQRVICCARPARYYQKRLVAFPAYFHWE
jgi:hypothetical protein